MGGWRHENHLSDGKVEKRRVCSVLRLKPFQGPPLPLICLLLTAVTQRLRCQEPGTASPGSTDGTDSDGVQFFLPTLWKGLRFPGNSVIHEEM